MISPKIRWASVPRTSITALLLGLFLNNNVAAVQMDRIAAVVNDDVITLSELGTRLATVATQLKRKNKPLPPRDLIVKQVLEALIINRIELQIAKQRGLEVSNVQVNQSITNIAKSNKLTIAQFRAALQQQGTSYAAFRQELKDEILVTQLRKQSIRNRISVTDKEVNDFLAKQSNLGNARSAYKLAHILIKTPEAPEPDQLQNAKNKIQNLRNKILAGDDFSAQAIAYSDGRKALSGGDMGWLQAAEVPTLFADVVKDMDRGGVSQPIRSASGYHIIQLIDYKGGDRLIVNQTKARHILIKPNEIVSDLQAKNRLEQLRQRIINGDDFATLARSHSDDTASTIEGGDLGWTSPGDLVPQFEDAMNALKPGELSEPFQTDFGWHIVQTLERRAYDRTQTVQRTRARGLIGKRKTAEETDNWLRRIRDEAYVEYRSENY